MSFAAVAMTSLPAPPASPLRLIIDTDPGIDDILAIVLALAHPEYARIEAITLNFGNTTLDHERSNILRLFSVLHEHVKEQPDDLARKKLAEHYLSNDAMPITLSRGAAGPLGGQRFTASYFHGRDGISGVGNDPSNPFPVPDHVPAPLKETSTHAVDVILDILRSNPPGTVRIAAIGPVTNLALAWQKDPETFLRVGGISVMGGALDVPGNTTPSAEFNTYADPFAAHVLTSEARSHSSLAAAGLDRLPIDLLPLDTTSKHVVPFSRLCDDRGTDKGILRRFMTAILASPRKVTQSFVPPEREFDAAKDDLFTAHDPLAVAHALFAPQPSHPERRAATLNKNLTVDRWTTCLRPFNIETVGEYTRGFYVIDRRQHGKAKPGKNRIEKEDDAQGEQQGHESKNATAQSQGVESTKVTTDGLSDVVVSSPGVKWFEEVFCSALGV